MDPPGHEHLLSGPAEVVAKELEKLERRLLSKDAGEILEKLAASPALMDAFKTGSIRGNSIFMHCVLRNHTLVCDWLIRSGVNVNQRDANGSTALHKACRAGNPETVKLLLQNGADITIASNHGFTPVMEATMAHRTLILELLLDHLFSPRGGRRSGCDGGGKKEEEDEEGDEDEAERARRIDTALNARQYKGQTALYITASTPDLREEAALLLQAGASPFIGDKDGTLPVQRAQQPKFFVERLEEAMREPQRAWRMAQARAVLDARQALQAALCCREEEGGEEEGQRGKASECKVLATDAVLKVVPACFHDRLVRRLEEEEAREEGGGEVGGKKGRKSRSGCGGLLDALPSVEWTPEEQEERVVPGVEAVRFESPVPWWLRAAAARAVIAAAAATAEKEKAKREPLLATMAFVMEGGLKEELWVELRELMCVPYDGAARSGLGEAGKWW